VNFKVPRTESVGNVHSVGDLDVERRLATAQDETSPRLVQLGTSDMAVQTEAPTGRRHRRFKSRSIRVPDGPGISGTCRNKADLTAALAAAHDLAQRARDSTNAELWKVSVGLLQIASVTWPPPMILELTNTLAS